MYNEFLVIYIGIFDTPSYYICCVQKNNCITPILPYYLRYSASFATAHARCEMPFLMSIPSCANDSV